MTSEPKRDGETLSDEQVRIFRETFSQPESEVERLVLALCDTVAALRAKIDEPGPCYVMADGECISPFKCAHGDGLSLDEFVRRVTTASVPPEPPTLSDLTESEWQTIEHGHYVDSVGCCAKCFELWPCPSMRARDTVTALRAELAALQVENNDLSEQMARECIERDRLIERLGAIAAARAASGEDASNEQAGRARQETDRAD